MSSSSSSGGTYGHLTNCITQIWERTEHPLTLCCSHQELVVAVEDQASEVAWDMAWAEAEVFLVEVELEDMEAELEDLEAWEEACPREEAWAQEAAFGFLLLAINNNINIQCFPINPLRRPETQSHLLQHTYSISWHFLVERACFFIQKRSRKIVRPKKQEPQRFESVLSSFEQSARLSFGCWICCWADKAKIVVSEQKILKSNNHYAQWATSVQKEDKILLNSKIAYRTSSVATMTTFICNLLCTLTPSKAALCNVPSPLPSHFLFQR